MIIEVRTATAADAHGIAVVHVTAWTEAYAHLVPADALARQSIEQRELRWKELIAAAASTVLIAMDGDAIVGFATAGPARDAIPPRDLELTAIYLLASHYGSSAGQALLDAAIHEDPASLWVAEDNPRARAFYERNGFKPDGTSDLHNLAGTPVRAIRMVR